MVASMLVAFPGAVLFTSLFEPDSTFPIFGGADIRAGPLNKAAPLRRHHRLALPLLAPAFATLRVDAEVTICSSSGWAHGARVTGRKIVYCYTPARWLYQARRYLGDQKGAKAAALGVLGPGLRRWDRNAARSADRYLVISTAVRDRVRDLYGINAEILPPCVSIRTDEPQTPFEGTEPGFWLCVSRLLPYKNVEAVLAAFEALPGERLILVGAGPEEQRIQAIAPSNVVMAGTVTDSQLAWLYANCQGLIAASYEDFGLTPLEANAFGKPVATLSWGGFLDTVEPDVTGRFFGEPTAEAILRAVLQVRSRSWSSADIVAHARGFDQAHFVDRLRAIVAEERGAG